MKTTALFATSPIIRFGTTFSISTQPRVFFITPTPIRILVRTFGCPLILGLTFFTVRQVRTDSRPTYLPNPYLLFQLFKYSITIITSLTFLSGRYYFNSIINYFPSIIYTSLTISQDYLLMNHIHRLIVL